MIIGISGKRGAGKTTVAKAILDGREGVHINFADPLKEIVVDCFGAATLDLHGADEDKAKELPCGWSGRGLMQCIGETFRTLWPDCWVHAWRVKTLRACAEYGQELLVVCSDVRFPNEVAEIHRLGGVVIRLTRNVHDDKHASEMALDGVGKIVMNGERGTRNGECCGGIGFDAVYDNAGEPPAETVGWVVDWLLDKGIL